MAEKQHSLDTLADDLEQYIESMAEDLVGGVVEGKRAPFALSLTQSALQDAYAELYGEMVSFPDGRPNEQGRSQLVERFGPDTFAEIVRAVRTQRLGPQPSDPNLPSDPNPPEEEDDDDADDAAYDAAGT